MIKRKKVFFSSKRSQEEGLGLGGSHTIEMIIAVLGLTLLLIFVVPVIMSFLNSPSQEKQQADATVDLIKADIENLADGQSKIFLINSPKDWYLQSFSKGLVPSSCSLGKDCLCICKKSGINSCNIKKESGCTSISSYNVMVNPLAITIKQYMRINITRIKNEISISNIK